jgi:ADP-heptose:LPS heptosyltransferase
VLVDGIVVALTGPEPGTVVALRGLGLGDLLTGVPALRGLRRRFPRARLVLAAPRRFRRLAIFCGVADAVVDTSGPGPVRGVVDPPDLAVNLHGRGPQSIGALLALRPSTVLTHRHDAYPDIAGPDWATEVHEVDRWCRLLHWAGIDCRSDDLDVDRPPGYPDCSDVVVVHPGAASASRRWPAERFAAVAAALHAGGTRVVVTGSADEAELVRQVVAAADLPADAAWPATNDLLALTALISDCRLLICGDTGVAHLATATGTPSVLLFGPTPPAHWGPRHDSRHTVLWAGDRGPHADAPDRGLLRLPVGQVVEAAHRALARCP